ncbi:MAG TPA: hypothetical protein VGD72_06500 [Mycobacteriales bacterium]|jgi:hypothetical protein
MTSNYPPPPNPAGGPGLGTPTEQLNMPPGMGTVMSGQPPHQDPLSVSRRGAMRSASASRGWRTSEFAVFAVMALGNLLAAALVGGRDGTADVFPADRAWFFATLLAVAYILSRGLAKIGRRGED